MVLQTLGKLATKALSVANNKAESLLNKGIEKLDALEQKETAPKAGAGAKRAKVRLAITCEFSNNTDLKVLLTKGDRTEQIIFRKNSEVHQKVLQSLVEGMHEEGLL